jgi:crotonobetainyl-CoA:carnitine CoA-transferase CaiB-like acyl-CoA transferase
MQPLADVLVLDFTTLLPGPLATLLLAEAGAEVIKIERPGGEVARRLPPFLPGHAKPISSFHATVNRNKRSLTLDLRKPEGRDVFLRLAARSDFVVENFRPGTLAGWGLGYADVRRVKPDVIYVSITGFGQFGPDLRCRALVGHEPFIGSVNQCVAAVADFNARIGS